MLSDTTIYKTLYIIFDFIYYMELRYFVIRRLLLLIPTLLGLTVITFILLRALPIGTVLSQYINPHAGNIPLQIERAKILLGLNYPAPLQYFFYINNLLHGNLGYMQSTFYNGSVLRGIELFLPNTLQITIFAVVLSVIIAIPVGTYIGARPNSFADQFGRVFSLTGYAMPAFWLALVLQIVFGKGILNWPGAIFPFYGQIGLLANPPAWLVSTAGGQLSSSPTHMIFFDALFHGDLAIAGDAFMHLVLPVLTLTYIILAGILRFMRAGMIDSTYQEYVKTARAKGVPEPVVIKKHIRKNALIPTVTVLGLLFASLLGGVVLIELVFLYPGMGLFGIEAVLSYSIYGVMGTTLFFGLFLVFANLVVDVVYAMMDPRIRY